MTAILMQTLPFFAVIGLGWFAGRTGFFSAEATAYLTKFVFYFALSAMLFRFAAGLTLDQLAQPAFVAAYLAGTLGTYLIATLVAALRRVSLSETAVEAQCAAIGNTGFLGIPMLTMLLGPQAIGPVMLCLSVDLIVFSSLIVILITAGRGEGVGLAVIGQVLVGLAKNPMIVAICAGLVVSAIGLSLPQPVEATLAMLGAAATPGALFAIGASLAGKSAERLAVAGWLSVAKLVLHPALVALAALVVFEVEPYAAGVMISAASLPVAGNVYILAQHYGVAPQRVSASILLSTTASVATVTAVIAWVSGWM